MTTPQPDFYPVILAGGSGERFWPLSRRAKPKQFLTLGESGRSLLQTTYDRLLPLCQTPEHILVVTSNEYRSQVLDQLPELPLENLLLEPTARDTAPAILYAALHLNQLFPQAVMGVFPADHHIANTTHYHQLLAQAIHLAHTTNNLITLGINPTFPATGYGYIQRGQPTHPDQPWPTYQVSKFTEKPDQASAQHFVQSGQYTWNSGMFIWSVSTILHAFRTHQPAAYHTLAQVITPERTHRAALRETFPTLPKISIDYAILEHSPNVLIIPADIGWDDLGDWNALERLLQNQGANVAVGQHLGIDTGGAILYATDHHGLIATIGLEDVVVVRAQDVTLVVRKDRTQDIKRIVQELKKHPHLEKYA